MSDMGPSGDSGSDDEEPVPPVPPGSGDDVHAAVPAAVPPVSQDPPTRPDPFHQRARDAPILDRFRGAASTAFLTRLTGSQALPGSKVRTLNINLLTPFPRKARTGDYLLSSALWKSWVALGIFVVVAVIFGLIAFALGRWWALAALVVMWLPILVALISRVVALPRSGEFVQWISQKVGGGTWQIDLFHALRRPPLRTTLWRGGPLLLLGTMAGIVIAALVALLPWWIAWLGIVIAELVFLWALWWLVVWLDGRARELGADGFMALPAQVKRLSMVHALSWTWTEPYETANGRSPYRPLLFVSTFNEANDGYVGGFIEAFGDGLSGAWGMSPRFPRYKGRDDRRDAVDTFERRRFSRAEQGFQPFLEFVIRTENILEHSYCAYPHLTAVDVRNSLMVDRELRSVVIERDAAGVAVTPARFERLLHRVRHALPSIPDTADALDIDGSPPPPMPGPGKGRTSSQPHTILVSTMPLGPDADVEQLRTLLRTKFETVAGGGGYPPTQGLKASTNSVFNDVEGTHLARLSIIGPGPSGRPGGQSIPVDRRKRGMHFEDHVVAADEAANQPIPAQLALAAHVDGSALDWLLRMHAAVDALDPTAWTAIATAMGQAPWADAVSFADFVLSFANEPLIRQVDHPDCTVWDVRRAAATHREFSRRLIAPGQPSSRVDAAKKFAYRG